MIDWRRGGWAGSINRLVRREVREQLSDNAAARRVRYRFAHRVVRRFFSIKTFGRFVSVYLVIDLLFVMIEAAIASTQDWTTLVSPPAAELAPIPAFLSGLLGVFYFVVDMLAATVNALNALWFSSKPASGVHPIMGFEILLLNVSGFLVAAQVGLLGVISLALALVTLIARGEGASTDVQVYYHESLSFELVASCVALLAVLCLQLLWPLQFLLHYLGFGGDLPVFKFGLLVIHMGWLLLNLGAVAYFISTTFRFVQQSARELLRERYTANVVLPREMTVRLRQQAYGLANQELLPRSEGDKDDLPSATFGFDYGIPKSVEVETSFARPTALSDVHMILVRWVVRRWSDRCIKAIKETGSDSIGRDRGGPRLWFTPRMDYPLRGTVGWCQRRGGVPLSSLEKFLLRRAFRFRGAPDEE